MLRDVNGDRLTINADRRAGNGDRRPFDERERSTGGNSEERRGRDTAMAAANEHANTTLQTVQPRLVTLEDLRHDRETTTLLTKANEQLAIMGFTEHGLRHASLVAHIAQNILLRLKYPERTAQLAAVAAYLHDIGNVITRVHHEQTGALIAMDILRRLGMDIEEIAVVAGAIGNHEENNGEPVSEVSAALILADKSDVHRSRVQNPNMAAFDIHDRVNYAAQRSFVNVDEAKRTITLELTIDTTISQVMEYFEIFLSRMVMCRRAAQYLKCNFELVINKNRLL
jgi:metal-dependent HD superfamily phosphatase/phosphodiesterase